MIINFKNKQINQIYYGKDGSLMVDVATDASLSSASLENDKMQSLYLSAIADEKIVLFDGRVLKRIRENLTVE